MPRFLVLLILLGASYSKYSVCCAQDIGFKEKQKQYTRVKGAYKAKEKLLQAELHKIGYELSEIEVFIRAFKKEAILEVFVKKIEDKQYHYFKTYDFCSNSGNLGPKRIEGDAQIPEGFYQIEGYNPYSQFHLSLRVNYPNDADLILSNKNYPGSEVYVQGDCVTIGCIPITDDKIKELYLLSVESKNNSERPISIHIFPFYLSDKNINNAILKDKNLKIHHKFWKELQSGFDFFEKNKTLPKISVNQTGQYTLQNHEK